MDEELPKLEEISEPGLPKSPGKGTKKGPGKGTRKGPGKGSGKDPEKGPGKGSGNGRARRSKRDRDVHHHYHMDGIGPHGYGPGGRPPADDPGWRKSYTDEEEGEIHIHYYYEPPRDRRRRSSKPTIAAVLMLLTGVLTLIGGAALTGLGSVPGDFGDLIEVFTDDDEGDISGHITAPNGTPLEGVKASVVGEPISTETDADGFYVLHDIPVGDHELKYELEGYNTLVYKTFVDPSDYGRTGHMGWGDWDSQDRDNDAHDFTLTEGNATLKQGKYVPWQLVKGIMISCGVLMIIAAIVVFIGAYNAYKRRNFGVAVVGAVVGMVSGVGLIFGLIALFVLALSRDEFRRRDEQPPNN